MGGGNSRYKIHPGSYDADGIRQKKVLKAGQASSSVVQMLQSSAQMTRHWQDKEAARKAIMTEEEIAAGRAIERSLIQQRSAKWLEAIAKPPRVNRFKDPKEMFLTRPQRLQLEHQINIAYIAKQQAEAKMARKPPYWSLMFTDDALIQYGDSLGPDAGWQGPRRREDNTAELAKHEGGALRTEDYFLTRQQRRELELQVELGFKRTMPHIRMPQLSLRYTDKTLLELAGTIDGVLLRNIPREPPKALRKPKPLPNTGPSSGAQFELFIKPIVEEHMRLLPATGAVVTLVARGDILYCKGFGITGRMDKVARAERRARQEAISQAKRRAREARRAAKAEERAARQAEAEARAQEEAAQREVERLHALGLKTDAELEQEQRLRELFRAVDSDGSGAVTTAELRGAMTSFGLDPASPAYAAVLARADEDGDGQVSLEEFMQAFGGGDGALGGQEEQLLLDTAEAVANENPTRQRLRQLFTRIDVDQSGMITGEELCAGLGSGEARLLLGPNAAAVDELASAMDADGDGLIGVEEFLTEIHAQGIERRVEKLRKRARRKRVKAAARTRKLVRMFESMDRDNDGTVSSKELFFGCMRAGLNIGLEDIKLMVRRADNGRNNQGDQMRLYDFISMFDGVDTGPPELPTPGGWQRIERPMARVHAALHKEQFVAARNILEKVTAELEQRRDFSIMEQAFGQEAAQQRLQKYSDYLDAARKFVHGKLGIDSQSSGSEPERDESGERVLSPEEESAARKEAERQERKAAMKLFREIDEDGSGSLSCQEVAALATAMGTELTQKALATAMAELDPDGDNTITFEEFYGWWTEKQAEQAAAGGSGGGNGGGGLFGVPLKGLGGLLGKAKAAGNASGVKAREGVLRVRVVSARGLPQMDAVGGCDPYCTLSHGSAAFRTKTRQNTLAPRFGEAFAFSVHDPEQPLRLQVFDADPMDADDLIGQLTLRPSQVQKGEEGSLAGEQWLPLEEARGGVDPVALHREAKWEAKPAAALKRECKKRGLKDEVEPGQDVRKVLARRLAHSGLGELRLNAVFLLEGDDEGGWDDDDDPEYTSSDEDELWEAVAEEIGTGRRPLDCQVRYVYHDTRGGELVSDGWSKPELADLKDAVSKYAEAVSPDFTSIPLGGVSRVATAVGVLQLAESGMLSLGDDVNQISTVDVIRHQRARLIGAGKRVDQEPGGGRYAVRDGDGEDERVPAISAAQLLTSCAGIGKYAACGSA